VSKRDRVQKLVESNPHALMIRAKFLGDYEIRVNDYVVSGLATQKNKALAAYLIVEHERDHPRSKLAALFWPDVPEQAALHNLRQGLSVIRKAFEPCGVGEVITANRENVGFVAGVKIAVDVYGFGSQMRLMIDRYHQQPGRGFPIQRLIKTLAIFKGEFLESIVLADSSLFSDWLVLKREGLNRLAVEGTSLLLQYFENRDEWSEARKAAETLVNLAPWDENVHSRLIHILLRLGQGNTALAHYQSAIRYFDEELGVEPELQLKNAYAEILQFFAGNGGDARKKAIHVITPGYSTPFIGRTQELETLEDWISDPACQLVTITGAGGSGKTRLAARLVESQQSLFSGGAFFISIAGYGDSCELASKILNAVSSAGEKSSDPLEELLGWATNRCTLLVLDNVENCEETAVLAAKLMGVCRQLVLVCTSYARLDLIGERVFALRGLSMEGGTDSEAVRLFISHLQPESQPEFHNDDFVKNIIDICNLVEGLPLAVDLAAGQIKRISSGDLLTSLEKTMNVLRSSAVNLPERHRSITASFENCWAHLPEKQQVVLANLAIFKSPFTLQSAAQVCGVSSEKVRDLVNQSLLIWDGKENYRFHRAVYQYAHEKMLVNDLTVTFLAKTHAEFFSAKLLDGFANFSGEEIRDFLQETSGVLPDILESIEFIIKNGEWSRLESLIHPLYSYYEALSLYREGSKTLEELASKCLRETNSTKCHMMFTSRASSLSISIQKFDGVDRRLEAALVVARESGNAAEEAFCYNLLAKLASVKKSSSTAIEYGHKALELSSRLGNQYEKAHALYNIGYALINLNKISEAEKMMGECREICETLKDWRRLAKVLNVLADTACYRGNFDQALKYYDEALTINESMENRYSQSLILNNLGTVYFSIKKYQEAEESYQKSLQICQEIDDREGEAIALSNLGELYAETREFRKGTEFNEQALTISLEIGSEWGEMSARVILAICYREMGDLQAARDELIIVLEKSLDLEFIYFFNRAVVEACRLLLDHGITAHLVAIIAVIAEDEESDDWVRDRAKDVQERLPKNDFIELEYNNRQQIKEFLVSSLQKIQD